MTSRLHTRILALVLILAGLAIFFTKVTKYDYPLRPSDTRTVWDVEIYLEFDTSNRPVRVESFIPARGPMRTVTEEQFYNGPFGLRLDSDAETGNRKAIWTYRYPDGNKVLRYRTSILEETVQTPLPNTMEQPPERADLFFESDLERQAFIVWSAGLRRQSDNDVSLVELALQTIFSTDVSDELSALIPARGDDIGRLELARAFLESEGVSARIANGIYLEGPRRRTEVHHWLEYNLEGEDRRYFPSGRPEAFFAMWYGVGELVDAQGVSDFDVQIGLQPSLMSAQNVLRNTTAEPSPLIKMFSFTGLAINTQLVYRVLVTIPVGILILVFLRQFVGLQTLGTFMPVLIGIAFRETALLMGIMLFTGLVILGLAMRFYLEKLQLLLVPRLAVVLTFIVLCMAGITIFMADNGQQIGLSISLFPMVILTMTIERMSIVWEEYSATDAIKQGLGSLLVASVTYLAMTQTQVEYLMFNFPELLLVIMGICLIIGKYMGLRLSELTRFKQLAVNQKETDAV